MSICLNEYHAELFTAQAWNGQELAMQMEPMPLKEAREWAASVPFANWTVRLMSDSRDYCEVFDPVRGKRCGAFGDVTLVRVGG